MKRTSMIRQSLANPRRTTLAHLKDGFPKAGAEDSATDGAEPGAAQAGPETGAAEVQARPLPQRTANPRRTVLNELPKTPVAP